MMTLHRLFDNMVKIKIHNYGKRSGSMKSKVVVPIFDNLVDLLILCKVELVHSFYMGYSKFFIIMKSFWSSYIKMLNWMLPIIFQESVH